MYQVYPFKTPTQLKVYTEYILQIRDISPAEGLGEIRLGFRLEG